MQKSPKRIKHLRVDGNYFPASLTSSVEKFEFYPRNRQGIPSALPVGIKYLHMNALMWLAALNRSDFIPRTVEECYIDRWFPNLGDEKIMVEKLKSSSAACWEPIQRLPNLRVFSWNAPNDLDVVIPASIKALMGPEPDRQH